MSDLRECRRCHGHYHDVFFRRDRRPSAIAGGTWRHTVCIRCEFEKRQAVKDARRSIVKAARTLRTHAEKYILRGLVKSKEEFARVFGWDLGQMAHDIEHTLANGCPYCQVAFASMHGGLHNVSLDIFDPKDPPEYRVNTRWVCKSCNSAKRDLSPREWGETLSDHDEWERQQEKNKKNPWGPLFGGGSDE